MVLSRHKSKKQKNYTRLGVITSVMNRLVAQAKGKLGDKTAYSFYNMFTDRSNAFSPKDKEDVRLELQNAWWIEEEDVRQFLYMRAVILFRKINRPITYTLVLGMLSYDLRDWLVDQGVFDHPSHFREEYQFHLSNHLLINIEDSYENIRLGVGTLLYLSEEESYSLSLYERYLLYCLLTTGGTRPTARTTGQERNQVRTEIRRLSARLFNEVHQ